MTADIDCRAQRLCWRCHDNDNAVTMRVLHGGEPIEGMLTCSDCWTVWEQTVQYWLDNDGPPDELYCEICQHHVDTSHITAEPLPVR